MMYAKPNRLGDKERGASMDIRKITAAAAIAGVLGVGSLMAPATALADGNGADGAPGSSASSPSSSPRQDPGGIAQLRKGSWALLARLRNGPAIRR